jgi:hypothetical protein
MSIVLLLGIALTTQARPAGLSPIDLHRSMEIELLDREIQRRHDTALYTRGRLTTAQRLAGRATSSQAQLERISLDLRSQEAMEVELKALRALKVQERDVLDGAGAAELTKAYDLLLDWVRAREAVARIDVERRESELERTRTLNRTRGATRQGLEDAELAHRASLAGLAELQTREAQVVMERAGSAGPKVSEPATIERLKTDYLQARLRSAQIQAENAGRRLEIARDRVRLGLMPQAELSIFEKAAVEATTRREAAKKASEAPPVRLDAEPGKPLSVRDALRTRVLAANLIL